MRRAWRLAVLAVGVLCACAPPPPKPQRDWINVILILSDDQGTADLGVCGSNDLHTPHLDRLASEGVRFTQFYAASAICSPSRAALLTGRYPQLAGVPGNVPPGGEGLPDEQITIAEVLRTAGYATGLIGKWHLGSAEGAGPRSQGFDYFFGHRQGCIDNYSHFFFWNGPNKHDLWRNETEAWAEGEHFGELMVRESERFLQRHRNQPFLLYLPFNTPHYPLQGLPKWRRHFAHLESPRSDYAALMATLDEQVGRILAELKRLGLEENTLIVFQSDHGHSTEVRSFSGGGNAGPYRGAKFSLFEGGIRVPAIARLPGRLPAGETRDQPAHAVDWFPTVLELCQVESTSSLALDGRSLLPIMLSDRVPTTPRTLFWEMSQQWAVLSGPWKLLHAPRDTDRSKLEDEDETFLVRLDEDPSEQRNLAAEHPETVERLRALHETWKSTWKPNED